MKYSVIGVGLIVLLIACNQRDKKTEPAPDTTHVNKPAAPAIDTTGKDTLNKHDTSLIHLSEEILITLKAKDFTGLSSFIHPKWGIRFSPYAYIDTTDGQLLAPADLISYGNSNKVLTWGQYDAKEQKIRMSIKNYFGKFVYDEDFLNAKQKSINEFLGSGNSLNNLREVFPGSDFTEFYFPGFDPKYEGMDWRTLRLVFKTENNRPWLIAIVHDEWTI